MILNITCVILSFICNNWFFLGLALISLFYNIYSYYSKNFYFDLIIADSKENVLKTTQISSLYKVKFIYYMIASIFGFTFGITRLLSIMDEKSLKIFFFGIFFRFCYKKNKLFNECNIINVNALIYI